MDKGESNSPAAAFTGVADILLVEDNPDDAQLTIRALERCGIAHTVEHVTDGTEALEYLASAGFRTREAALPKFILLDLNLNKMGGLDVLRQLKSDKRTRRVPIIVLTASRSAIELVVSYELGVNSLVVKPTDAEIFTEAVAAIGQYWLGVNELPPY